MSKECKKAFMHGIHHLKTEILQRLIDRFPSSFLIKSPTAIYKIIKDLHNNPYTVFAMNKAQFYNFLSSNFEVQIQQISDEIVDAMGFRSKSKKHEASVAFDEANDGPDLAEIAENSKEESKSGAPSAPNQKEKKESGPLGDLGQKKHSINVLNFITLIILLSKFSISHKINLILITYDMQATESISLSELLIAIKSVLSVTECFKDISDSNLELFVESL